MKGSLTEPADCGWKDLWNRYVFSLEEKAEGVTDGDCDEVICTRCKVNQEESEQNEVDGMKKGADSTDKAMHMEYQLVICNEKDTDGQARAVVPNLLNIISHLVQAPNKPFPPHETI